MFELLIIILLMCCYTLRVGVNSTQLNCGIFGAISGYLNESEIENFRTLGAISYPRGDDSTGVMWARRPDGSNNYNDLVYGFDKAVADPWGYLYSKNVREMLSPSKNFRAMIGHCRSATVGEVNRDNAHPFRFSNIIGVHNGTIQGIEKVNTNGTDSEEIFRRISTKGPKETLIELKNGAYSLLWFDMNDHTLNIIRNDQRPLWIMRNSACNTFYIASERVFLDYIDIRSNATYEDPVSVETNTLYQFNMKQIGAPKLVKDFVPSPSSVPFFSRRSGISDKPAWEGSSLSEEKQDEEQKKEPTKEVAKVLSLPPPQKDKQVPSFVDDELVLTITDKKCLEEFKKAEEIIAEEVLPPLYSKMPSRIILEGAVFFLRHRIGDKYISPQTLQVLLSHGSAWSCERPTLHTDTIYWLDNETFIMADEANDKDIRIHLLNSNNPPVAGEHVYICARKLQSLVRKSNVKAN